MKVKLVKSIPNFSEQVCCGVPAVGIWRVSPREKWKYLCADCLAQKLDLEADFLREVCDV
jgi:hypothetical protein